MCLRSNTNIPSIATKDIHAVKSFIKTTSKDAFGNNMNRWMTPVMKIELSDEDMTSGTMFVNHEDGEIVKRYFHKHPIFHSEGLEVCYEVGGGYFHMFSDDGESTEDIIDYFTRIFEHGKEIFMKRFVREVKSWVSENRSDEKSSFMNDRSFRSRLKSQIKRCLKKIENEFDDKGREVLFDVVVPKDTEYFLSSKEYTDTNGEICAKRFILGKPLMEFNFKSAVLGKLSTGFVFLNELNANRPIEKIDIYNSVSEVFDVMDAVVMDEILMEVLKEEYNCDISLSKE